MSSSVASSIVVEGDIFVGGVSRFSISALQPLYESDGQLPVEAPEVQVMVQDRKGNVYQGKTVSPGNYLVDSSSADPEGEYRLLVTVPSDGVSYATEWSRACGTCEMDNLKYEISEDGTSLSVLLSLHSDGESRNFRYRYSETYEYTAPVYSYVYYDPATNAVLPFRNGENTYYCWRTADSHGINLVSTEDMAADRLEDLTILTYSDSDKKLNSVYRIDIEVYPVDPAGYRYYEHLKEVSTFDGDLFSPLPSEMRGNIICLTDPDVQVYGYVSVVRPSFMRLEILNSETHFHRPSPVDYITYSFDEGRWPYFYGLGYSPMDNDPMQGVIWTERRCVDCRTMGGTKERPEGWPNSHK